MAIWVMSRRTPTWIRIRHILLGSVAKDVIGLTLYACSRVECSLQAQVLANGVRMIIAKSTAIYHALLLRGHEGDSFGSRNSR